MSSGLEPGLSQASTWMAAEHGICGWADVLVRAAASRQNSALWRADRARRLPAWVGPVQTSDALAWSKRCGWRAVRTEEPGQRAHEILEVGVVVGSRIGLLDDV